MGASERADLNDPGIAEGLKCPYDVSNLVQGEKRKANLRRTHTHVQSRHNLLHAVDDWTSEIMLGVRCNAAWFVPFYRCFFRT